MPLQCSRAPTNPTGVNLGLWLVCRYLAASEHHLQHEGEHGGWGAVSSKQVRSQLCHSASSWPWNSFTESKEPYSEFIAVPEKSCAPLLCFLSAIGNELLFKSSSQPPSKPHCCWYYCCSLQKERSNLCRITIITFSANHRRFISETK